MHACMLPQVARFAFGDVVMEPQAAAQEAMKEAPEAVRQGEVPDVAKHGGRCTHACSL